MSAIPPETSTPPPPPPPSISSSLPTPNAGPTAAAAPPPPPTASSWMRGNTSSGGGGGGNGSGATVTTGDRIAAHTHVTGLGLQADGTVDDDDDDDTTSNTAGACGLIGQVAARQASGLVVDLIQSQRFAGRGVLLVGPPGTGKTALATAISKELGRAAYGSHGRSSNSSSSSSTSSVVPFVTLAASQVYSQQYTKTAVLTQHARQAIGLRIRESKEVYEGEVTELTVEETADPLATATSSYGRTISHVLLTLKTTKGTKTLRLDPTMYEALAQEQVTVGDVIYIEANSGAVKRVGRSDNFAAEFDLEAEEFVPIPKGDVHKKKQVVQDVTLHDLDVANAQPAGSGSGKKKDVLSLMAALGQPRHVDMTEKLRAEINKVVQKYVDEGVAELVPGVLFIDEVHMLDQECFTFLHRMQESSLAPILILATNRGVTRVRGSSSRDDDPFHSYDEELSPHGIPLDYLDRLLIVPTHPYSVNEMRRILQIRSKTERVTVDDAALIALAELGAQTSLRFAVQMLTPARILAETAGRSAVTIADVDQVQTLFVHAKHSARQLQQQQQQHLQQSNGQYMVGPNYLT